MTLDRHDSDVNRVLVAVTSSTYLRCCQVTFQTWVDELIKQRYGGIKTALANAIEMELSPFSRGVAAGTLNVPNLLRLAHVGEEHPSIVLRLAGKQKEADLFDAVYGSAHEVITASERELLAQWRQLTPRAREGLRLTIRELSRVAADPIPVAAVSGLDTRGPAIGPSLKKRSGRALAQSDRTDQTPPLPIAPDPTLGDLATEAVRLGHEREAQRARATGQPAASARPPAAGVRARRRGSRR